MRGKLLIATFVFLCVFAIPSAKALIGAEGTEFSSNGYLTTISISYEDTMQVNVVEGGGGSGDWLNSILTIKIYDNTTDLPYVELYDNDDIFSNFTMYEKEVAKITIKNLDNETDTIVHITDMLGSKSAWINLVDYTCTGNEDIRKFWVYKEGFGFPDALIFSWLEDCEQFVIPLYTDVFPL